MRYDEVCYLEPSFLGIPKTSGGTPLTHDKITINLCNQEECIFKFAVFDLKTRELETYKLAQVESQGLF